MPPLFLPIGSRILAECPKNLISTLKIYIKILPLRYTPMGEKFKTYLSLYFSLLYPFFCNLLTILSMKYFENN